MSRFANSTMSETDFIGSVARRTGCGLLLDVNNVFVSAANHGFSALEYLVGLPAVARCGEIHLAGHSEQTDDEGDRLIIDSHDGPVADAVWKLYEIVIARAGSLPTLDRMGQQYSGMARARGRSGRRPGDPRSIRRSDHRGEQQCCLSQSGLNARRPETPMRPCFRSALLRPERETPSLIAGPKGKGAVKRYNVYRNNVTVSLIEALAAIFPAVRRITGEEFFRAMARFHIRETPPTSPLLFEYGRDFPAFIARYEYAQDMPWLADVARIERAWLDAYHAADAEPLSPSALAAVPAERLGDLVFTPHPAARIVRSRFAAVTIFAANRSERSVREDQRRRARGRADHAAGILRWTCGVCRPAGPSFSPR